MNIKVVGTLWSVRISHAYQLTPNFNDTNNWLSVDSHILNFNVTWCQQIKSMQTKNGYFIIMGLAMHQHLKKTEITGIMNKY